VKRSLGKIVDGSFSRCADLLKRAGVLREIHSISAVRLAAFARLSPGRR
jgi:hypothetical protein